MSYDFAYHVMAKGNNQKQDNGSALENAPPEVAADKMLCLIHHPNA